MLLLPNWSFPWPTLPSAWAVLPCNELINVCEQKWPGHQFSDCCHVFLFHDLQFALSTLSKSLKSTLFAVYPSLRLMSCASVRKRTVVQWINLIMFQRPGYVRQKQLAAKTKSNCTVNSGHGDVECQDMNSNDTKQVLSYQVSFQSTYTLICLLLLFYLILLYCSVFLVWMARIHTFEQLQTFLALGYEKLCLISKNKEFFLS